MSILNNSYYLYDVQRICGAALEESIQFWYGLNWSQTHFGNENLKIEASKEKDCTGFWNKQYQVTSTMQKMDISSR